MRHRTAALTPSRSGRAHEQIAAPNADRRYEAGSTDRWDWSGQPTLRSPSRLHRVASTRWASDNDEIPAPVGRGPLRGYQPGSSGKLSECGGGSACWHRDRPFLDPGLSKASGHDAHWCRAADPGVGRVALVLPVAVDDVVRDFDPVQPLDRLVAVHGCDVQPNGTAVVCCDVGAEHLVRHEDVGTLRLRECETLGVDAVGREESRARLPQVSPRRV